MYHDVVPVLDHFVRTSMLIDRPIVSRMPPEDTRGVPEAIYRDPPELI